MKYKILLVVFILLDVIAFGQITIDPVVTVGRSCTLVCEYKNSPIKIESQLVIKDLFDNNPIPAATVLFTTPENRKKKIAFVADESGVINIEKLSKGKEYIVTVSAAGYNNYSSTITINKDDNEILLERAYKECMEVKVKAIVDIHSRTISCGGEVTTLYCKCSGLNVQHDSVTIIKKSQETSIAKIFPNPASRGSKINIEWQGNSDQKITARVLLVDGRCEYQENYSAFKGVNRFAMNIPANWSAGIHFINLVDASGKIVYQNKFIIQ